MAGEDRGYLQWIATQPCAARELRPGPPCAGGVVAHHAGRRGLSQRAHDHTCIPLCDGHHRAYHEARAPFAAMGRDGRRAWADAEIECHRARHALPLPPWA